MVAMLCPLFLSHCLMVLPMATWSACVRGRATGETLKGLAIEDVMYTFSTTGGEWGGSRRLGGVGRCVRPFCVEVWREGVRSQISEGYG
jgi:hypothetical protein